MKKYQQLDQITAIKLCTSHLTKNMKNDLFKAYKEKQDLFFVASIIGAIFDMTSFVEIDSCIKKLIIILKSKFESPETLEAKKSFEQFPIEPMNVDEMIPSDDHNFEEFDIIYRNSKFFQMYSKFAENFELKNASKKVNSIYNPTFVDVFLKKYLAFLPLWTPVLTALRSRNFNRANNGIIEGMLSLLKFYLFVNNL